MSFVGLDVGSKTVVLGHRQAGRTKLTATFEQTPAQRQALIARVKALQPMRVVLEATGVYHVDLALGLAAAGLPVAVINARSFHHFAEMKLKGSKTDPIDAALLAEYAERMDPPLWQPPAAQHLALRDIGRQINRLTHTRAQAKNRLHALQAKADTLPLLIEDEQEAVATLDRRLKRLLEAAEALVAQSPDLAAAIKHLTAAKGIGRASAIALMAELCVLPRHLKAAQVVRHAGLDVRHRQSGTSVSAPGRLGKGGNAYMRCSLYMPSLTAVQHDPNARAFYEALQRRGKKKRQALCAVMRKYLTGIWACLQLQQDFDSSKLFSDIHHAKT